jgi:hypothetical protein
VPRVPNFDIELSLIEPFPRHSLKGIGILSRLYGPKPLPIMRWMDAFA